MLEIKFSTQSCPKAKPVALQGRTMERGTKRRGSIFDTHKNSAGNGLFALALLNTACRGRNGCEELET